MVPANRNHFLALDSLRGICATFVVFFHFNGDAFIKTIPFIENAFLFVDFFFVLSGFVIAASYGDRLASGFSIFRFMFLRIGRLYPLHLAVLTAYLIVAAAKQFNDEHYTTTSFFLNMFLLQVWAPYKTLSLSNWNPPSWSISAEIWTYLLFAFIVTVSKKKIVVTLTAVIAIAAPILFWGDERHLNICFAGDGFVRCSFGFSLGVLAFFAWEGGRFAIFQNKWKSMATLAECAMVASCLTLVSFASAGPLSLLCPPLFSATVVLFAHEAGSISRILLRRPLLAIGTMSYSIYMIHEFVLARFVNLVTVVGKVFPLAVMPDPINSFALNSAGFAFGSDIAAIMGFACVVAVSVMTYKFIESPCREWSRQIMNARYAKTGYEG